MTLHILNIQYMEIIDRTKHANISKVGSSAQYVVGFCKVRKKIAHFNFAKELDYSIA